MIEIEDVHRAYGDVVALDGVSLSVDPGEAVGLVGTNGAGKTTLFRLLVGHERPDSGTVRVAGLDPTDGVRVRRRVGYLPEDAGFQPALTGREVLEDHARMRDATVDVERLLAVVGLTDAADRRVGGYSNGMGRRLALATALLDDPPVLLLDEPTASLDPAGVSDFNRVVRRVRDERDVTVLLSTHALREVEALCDRVAILANGRVETVGAVEDVSRAAGGGVTVTAHYADVGAAERAADRLRETTGIDLELTDSDPSRDSDLSFVCERDRVPDVLGTVVATNPQTVSVEEPGLADAFRETALGGETA